jgi:hypothetical protein
MKLVSVLVAVVFCFWSGMALQRYSAGPGEPAVAWQSFLQRITIALAFLAFWAFLEFRR